MCVAVVREWSLNSSPRVCKNLGSDHGEPTQDHGDRKEGGRELGLACDRHVSEYLCIRYFSHCYDQIVDKKQFKGRRA